MAAPLVVVDRLTKLYGRTTVLHAVSLTIRRGEVLGLIGPNGAGKTTLFECAAGVLPYASGDIRIDGRAVTPGAGSRSLFYLPDAIAPWPAQRVAWALDYVIGFFRGDPAQKAPVIERLGLSPLLSFPIGTLSKGQRKRVLLALGMLTPHPLLLCDEPFDGLDLKQTREMGAALREHAAAGRTLFLPSIKSATPRASATASCCSAAGACAAKARCANSPSGTGTQDVSAFLEKRFRFAHESLLLRLEGFNLLNHGNILGRAQTIYGDTGTGSTTFGQIVTAGTAANALPALANIDPPRMVQFQVRVLF